VNTSILSELKKQAQQAWPELDLLIGWETGYDTLHTTPVFIKDSSEIQRLVWNPFCAQNLAGYLVKSPIVPRGEGSKKIGICVKGCDSRSVVALIQEKLVARDMLFIFGIPCRGVIDLRKLIPNQTGAKILSVRLTDDQVEVEHSKGLQHLAFADVLMRKCKRCRYPDPVIHDVLLGESVLPRIESHELYQDVAAIERLSLQERLAFWQTELDRCLRCYACRNACPLCVCQDRCIAETRDPKWLTQYMNLPEKFMFHFIHALHLAGRCTECGECERVCPMEIPVSLIKEELNKITKELLDFEAGLDLEGVPPLLTFSPAETGI
jgi:ferredoxin